MDFGLISTQDSRTEEKLLSILFGAEIIVSDFIFNAKLPS